MRILHQGEGGYHMGAKAGAGCTHDHGDGGHDHDHGDGGHGHSHEGGDTDHYNYHGGHSHDHEEAPKAQKKEARRNINVDAAFLHALGDMIMSIGVCCAATIIYF